MNKLPQISDAEFEVMDIIWKYAPISTNEITDRLAKTKNWSPKTIYTMLSRLEKKGVIVHEKESRVFVYTKEWSSQPIAQKRRIPILLFPNISGSREANQHQRTRPGQERIRSLHLLQYSRV